MTDRFGRPKHSSTKHARQLCTNSSNTTSPQNRASTFSTANYTSLASERSPTVGVPTLFGRLAPSQFSQLLVSHLPAPTRLSASHRVSHRLQTVQERIVVQVLQIRHFVAQLLQTAHQAVGQRTSASKLRHQMLGQLPHTADIPELLSHGG